MSGLSGLKKLDRVGSSGSAADEPSAQGDFVGTEAKRDVAAPPVSPTTLGNLVAELTRNGHRRPGRLPPGLEMDVREDAEASSAISTLLMSAAAMAADIEGFPDDIVLRGPYDDKPKDKWAAVRKDEGGVWRLVLQGTRIPHDDLVTFGRGSFVYAVGRAMGFDNLTQGAYDTLSRYGKLPVLPQEVEPFIAKIEASVPLRALATPVFEGLGNDFSTKFQVAPGMADAWISAMAKRGIDPTKPRSVGGQAPLARYMREFGMSPHHVGALIDAGADIEMRGQDGRTPLLHVISRGNLNVAMLLVEKGADVNAQDRYGASAMDLLISNAHRMSGYQEFKPSDMARALLEAGAMQDAEAHSGWAEKVQDRMDSMVGSLAKAQDEGDEESAPLDDVHKTYAELGKLKEVVERGPVPKP